MEGCYMNEDIVVEILCRLPRKSLCRFKCVSKQWFNLISDRSRVRPQATRLGLVVQNSPSADPPRPVIFLRLDNKGRASVDRSIDFDFSTKSNWVLYDSCGGLLLFVERNVQAWWVEKIYLVFNPVTKRLLSLVPPTNQSDQAVCLVSDGDSFKVLFFIRYIIRFELIIFSSEDGKWRRKDIEAPHGFSLPPKDGFYKVIDLPPRINATKAGGQCIWEFEGSLHYCKLSSNRVDIWVLHMEEQTFEWQHKHVSVFAIPTSITELNPYFSPFAFHPDYEILYLWCKESIISYNLVTGTAEEAYASPRNNFRFLRPRNVSYPFLYVTC